MVKRRLAYLCLQATREGQASYAHVHEIIKGLKRRGWVVNLFEPSYAKVYKIINPLKRLQEFLRVQLRLWFHIRREKIDILYIRWHFASFFTVLWARRRRLPVIQEVNGPYEDLFIAWPWTRHFTKFFIWLMRTQLHMAEAVITVTPQLASWVQKETNHDRVYVIPNGADTTLFYPGAMIKPGLLQHIKKPYVIFFGAFAPWQGIETMLKALRDPTWPETVYLVIVGDGVGRKLVENASVHTERLIYIGPQPYAYMPGLIANSIAGLCPKNNKGQRSDTGLFPLKLFETLSCGVPVIVTDFPGMADFVRENSCGLVIPPDKPEALAEAVRYIFENPQIGVEMGMRGRSVIEKKHSWDARASVTDKILSMLIQHEEA
ncbi:MAG TPA: glycosyltransferase WbuB [Thermoanaerobacter sp.]|nr:glycosyltransferase WbuB [Thermoanaerobacter sp.]